MEAVYNPVADEETLSALKRLQTENKQLNRRIRLLQKKIDAAETAAQTDRLIGDIRSVNQKKLEKYMTLLLEYSQVAILMLDEYGRIAYCTNEFVRLAGIDNFGIINGRALRDVFSIFEGKKFVDEAIRLFEEVKDNLRPVTFNTKIFFPANSTERLYTIQLDPITENGVFDGEIIICHDTTDLRNAEAEKRTRLMLDSTPVACTLWTADGELIGWNKKTKELLNLNYDEINEEIFFSRCADIQDDNQRSPDKWNRLLKTTLETGTVETDWNCVINDEEFLPLRATFVRMPWKDSFCVAVYAVNLRELRMREMAVRKANEENYLIKVEAKTAEAASNAKSNFLAIMSHELRTPLNVIIGMSELMPTNNLNKTQKKYFSDIQIMSKSLFNLINDILDFSKIEADKFDILPVSYSIKELINNVDATFRHIAKEKNISFSCHVADDIPDVLYGDEIRIRQVFINITSNAVKYTHEGSVSVTVNKTMKDDKAYFEFCVKDTGIGIKTEDIPKLFTAFQQVDKRKNRGIMGTGLGLAISKKLSDVMGGIIEVESEYGKGSVFRVLFPLIEGEPNKLADSKKKRNFVMVKRGERITALVVDDMPENNTIAKGFLALHGIDTDTVLSGEDALKKISTTKYNIIFMDQMMPEMDGLDTARHIRALTEKTGDKWFSEIPIIALSANVVSGVLDKFKDAGMNDFVGKPIDSKTLNAKLSQWLPPDKIEFAGHPNDQSVAADDETGKQLFEQLKKLPEIDSYDGLAHTGSVSSYIKLIRQFYTGFDKSALALQNFLEKNDRNSYHIKIHALKGLLATLGLKSLSEWAKKLELASAEGEDGFPLCRDETPLFINECRKFFNRLPEEFTVSRPTEKKNRGDINVFWTNLNKLKPALETGHANSIKELIERLNPLSFDKETDGFISELSDLILDFDYDIALQKIEGFENGKQNKNSKKKHLSG
ncbi:MAG: response regulator [Spirochaetaceae bacterium]|jgi:signal transduction histidine kinase/CheY-like chemotaxis protein/PAS domain-containing protein|nr:response regulator [Spirochaetaceae bacterium]